MGGELYGGQDPGALGPPRQVDLDAAERVIHRPHVIDLREDGWTIMHPPACHPDLFTCPVNQAAGRNLEEPPPQAPGRYFCEFDPDGVDWGFVIGEPAGDAQGIDWVALVAELRAARETLTFLYERLAQVYERLAQDGYEPAGPLPARIRDALAARREEG